MFKHIIQIQLIIFCLASLSLQSYAGGAFEDIEKQLEVIEKHYQQKQYKKAELVLKRVVKETGIDDTKKDYAMGYPESIRSSIKYWQNVFEDRKGYFRDFPTVTGIVVEQVGNMAGYFNIKKGKTIRSFTYERNILVVGGEISVGRKVTVYYIPESGKFDTALKVAVHAK